MLGVFDSSVVFFLGLDCFVFSVIAFVWLFLGFASVVCLLPFWLLFALKFYLPKNKNIYFLGGGG